MAETIGTVIGTIIAWLIILAIPGVSIFLFVKRRKKRRTPEQSAHGSHRASGAHLTAQPAQQQVPGGWYPDPNTGNELRWWDGFAWGILQSEHFSAPQRAAPEQIQDVAEAEDWRAVQDRELNGRFNEKMPDPLIEKPVVIARPTVDRRRPATSSKPVATTPVAVRPRKISRNSKPKWIAAGQPIEVDGYVIPGGLLYVGRNQSLRNTEPEPSLIDPSLKVNSGRPDYAGHSFSYWPSYHRMSAEARAAYLEWLSHGRRNADVPIGYVFLFMYGLERRVLTEIANDAKLAHEVPAIQTEMQELLALHEDEYSFQSYGCGFLSVLELIALNGDPEYQFTPPPLTDYRWAFPLGLRVELGSLAADGKPVGPEWALAWAWFHEGTRIRTPATRCFDEFKAVFKSLYTQAHGDGLVPKQTKRKLKIVYNPASSAIPTADIALDGISDVFQSPTITRELERLADQAQDSLDSYSRFVGKNPNATSSLKAQALLPSDVLDRASQASTALRALLEPAAANGVNVDAATLIDLWNGSATDRLPKQESIQLCQLAEKLGFGLEPDPRFGGPVFQMEVEVTVFPVQGDAPQIASPEFTTALTLAHLAVAVSRADGRILEAETSALFGHVESSLGLNAHEGVRLEAHARWLGQSEVKLTGLTKRVASLSASQRDGLGRLLVDIAAVDGVVKPEEVRTISRIYKLLGLDGGLVTSRLHQAMTGTTIGRDEPVIVRPAEQGEPGSPIPPRPTTAPVAPGFVLDKASIAAKMRDTAAVSAILANIFDEEAGTSPAGRRVATPTTQAAPDQSTSSEIPAARLIAGLDAMHSELFSRVTQQPEVSREEFDALCRTLGLLPNGALDTLNDAALEASDEPLFDGEDHLIINPYSLEEMLR